MEEYEVKTLKEIVQENPDSQFFGVIGSSLIAGELSDPTLARKTSKESFRCPYHKPTQVDEKKILRRSREPSLRNSAN